MIELTIIDSVHMTNIEGGWDSMPYKQTYYPNEKKRRDAQIGNTSVWPFVERAKRAGVSAVQGWRRNKTVGSVAEELRCYDSVNAIIEALEELTREKKSK